MELREARVQLIQTLDRELQRALANPASPAPVILVRAPGGLGKTRTTARLVRDRRVVWFGERIEMVEQLQQFLAEPLLGLDPPDEALPPGPVVEKRPARADRGMCANPAELKRARHAGLGRFEQRLVCGGCAQRGECPYFQWRPSSRFIFAPHVWLSLPLFGGRLFEGRELVVIDESFLSTVLKATTLSPKDIQAAADACAATPDGPAAGAFRDLFAALSDLFAAPPPGRKRIELRLLLEDLGYRFIDGAGGWTGRERTDPNPPLDKMPKKMQRAIEQARRREAEDNGRQELTNISHRDVRAMLVQSGLPGQTNEWLIGLFDALAADNAPRPTCVAVLPRKGWAAGLVAGRHALIEIPPELPIVMLDATGRQELYEELFPNRTVRVVDADVEQQATIFQTVDHRYPQSTFTDPKGKGRAVERLTGILHWHHRNHPNARIGVVVSKSALSKLPTLDERLRDVVKPEDIVHLWALRGDNRLQDCDALFIIGAPELPPLQLEAMCRALMARSGQATAAPCSYTARRGPEQEPQELLVELVDGTAKALEHRCLDHSVADLVYQALHQGEIEQAVLRARPLDGTRDKKIFILASLPLIHARLDIQYVRENSLYEGDPRRPKTAIHRAEEWLRQKREEGRRGPISQRELASSLEISEGLVSQWKKDPRYPTALRRVLALLRGDVDPSTGRDGGRL